MSIPPKRNVLNEKSPNHDRRFAPFALTIREKKNLKHRDSKIQHDWTHEDDRDSVWIPLRTWVMCEAFDDLEEGYFISERLTGLELPSIPCLSKDARVRRTGFMSDGNGRWSCYASLKGQGLAFCTIGVEKERLLFDQLWLHVNVLCLFIPIDVSAWA